MPIDSAPLIDAPDSIAVSDLHQHFGKHHVLRGVSLRVARGEVYALLGTNGAGKTTVINILTTLVRPTEGSAMVAGFDVRSAALEVRRRISLTGQSTAVDEGLSAMENLRLMCRLAGLPRREAARHSTDLLARFGLSEAANRRVRTFSGGMRRRLDLALSFVVTPEVLFLDEPTTGLDTRSRREVWDLVTTLASAGTTVFLTTQYLEEADQLADRIAVLDGGRIVAEGTPSRLKEIVGGDVVELHDSAGALTHRVSTDGSVAGMRRVLDALDAEGATGVVTLRRPTMDDVFLTLTGGDASAATPMEPAA